MRKNIYNNNLLMINIRELHYAMNSLEDLGVKKLLNDLINTINSYTSMQTLDFNIAILEDNYNVKLRKIVASLKEDFFNPQEYINTSDYQAAAGLVEENLSPELIDVFKKLSEDNMTGFKRDIINCSKDEKRVEKVLDFVLAVRQYKGNFNLERSVYVYDGSGLELSNSQDPKLIGPALPYDSLTRVELNDVGNACVYFDINGCVFETEYLTLLKKTTDQDIFPGEVIGENAEFLKEYLDSRCIYDNTQLLQYMNKTEEDVKEYRLKQGVN